MATIGNMLADSGNSTTILKYVEGTFTPTVTLVGGAGNTVPVYTTNTGRYTRIGNRIFVDILLTGDGGDEGAGTGVINVALPIAASASNPGGYPPCGRYENGATVGYLAGLISGGGSTIRLLLPTGLDMTGADQNNASRTIRLQFQYEA